MSTSDKDSSINIDEWIEGFAQSPEQFEKKRLALIEATILKAPLEQQKKLRELQFKIDEKRALSNDPMACCLEISTMMWDSLITLEKHLNQLCHSFTDKDPFKKS